MTQNYLTVLVIGAGANADFKFRTKKKNEENEKETIAMPTGEQLVEKIADWEGQVLPNLYYGFFEKAAKDCGADEGNSKKVADFFSNQFRDFFNESAVRDTPDLFAKSIITKLESLSNQIVAENFAKVIDFRLVGFLHSYDFPQNNFLRSAVNQIEESEEFGGYHKISQIVKHYQPFSIDEILDSIKIGKIDIKKWSDGSEKSRESLIQAGKDLVALFLLQSEDKKVFDYEASCWYRHLRNAIITCGKNKKEIEKKLENFVIISFNYDRSLDYFLRTRVGEFYEKIRVIYPYGSLAKNDIWDVTQDKKEKDYRKISYGSVKGQKSSEEKWRNFEQAKKLAENLKVIGELEEYDEGKKKIKEMQECMKIFGTAYFLGFAFHKENCQIMGLDKKRFEGSHLGFMRDLETNTVFYTNFGESDKIRDGFNYFFNSVVAKKEFEKKQRELEEKGSKNRKDFFEIGRSSKKGTHEALALDFDFKL